MIILADLWIKKIQTYSQFRFYLLFSMVSVQIILFFCSNFPQIVSQLRQKLLAKEEELGKLIKDCDQLKIDCETRCQKMDNTVRTIQDGKLILIFFTFLYFALNYLNFRFHLCKISDYRKLKSDYDILCASNLKTLARSQELEKDLTELEVRITINYALFLSCVIEKMLNFFRKSTKNLL